MSTSDSDEKYMLLALELAAKGKGKVEPNPMVGAVLVKNNLIIGKGYHKDYGGAHAEIHAIHAGGENCKGATLYVTMEPCAHQGKTSPCVEAVIDAGIRRVVTTGIDPNPITSGKGIQRLRDAGIEVQLGVFEEQAKSLNAPFFKLIQKGMPYVMVKWAMSLDGRIASRTGKSQWITSEESRRYVHKIRGQIDGIMVGINTVLQDDPLLTCRIGGGRNPKRIIIDANALLPLDSRLVKSIHEGEVFVVTQKNAPHERIKKLRHSGCEIIQTENNNGRVHLKELLQRLGFMQLTNLLVEGGSSLVTSFIDERLADKVMVFIAPVIIGGRGAKSPVLGNGIDKIDDARRLYDVTIQTISSDVLIAGSLRSGP